MRKHQLKLLTALAIMGVASAPVRAQSPVGVVVGDSTHQPLANVRVRLVDSTTHKVVDSTTTSASGVFYTTAPAAGTYSLEFLRDDAVPRSSPYVVITNPGESAEHQFLLPDGIERTAYFEHDVDREVEVVPGGPFPRFPDGPRGRDIGGNVVVQFIVDTTGVLVPGSTKVILSTLPDFTKSVETLLPKMHFYPALLNGAKVRQVACMPFTFRLGDDENTKALDKEMAALGDTPGCPLGHASKFTHTP